MFSFFSKRLCPHRKTQLLRYKHEFTPRRVDHAKRFKGRVPIPTGGSERGMTLKFGDYGLRLKGEGVRMTAKQLTVAQATLRRLLKPHQGKVWVRVQAHIPVTKKGSNVRMGKGKGAFEYWAARIPSGRVLFELGGTNLHEAVAREAVRQAGARLPGRSEFVTVKQPFVHPFLRTLPHLTNNTSSTIL